MDSSEFEAYNSYSQEGDRFQTHHVSDEETLILRFPSSFFNSLNGYCINEDEEITTQRFIFFKERSYSITISCPYVGLLAKITSKIEEN